MFSLTLKKASQTKIDAALAFYCCGHDALQYCSQRRVKTQYKVTLIFYH